MDAPTSEHFHLVRNRLPLTDGTHCTLPCCRYAQELLLQKDISLVLNVKHELLERVARCTGALVSMGRSSDAAASPGHKL